ncbi:MAG: hypothetical protein M3O46_02875 [Myxococcota bacterium]|nr:hypothetical protein [Myxococcota bacterium]
MRPKRRRTWHALILPFFAAGGCNQLIGASDPIARQEDSSVGQACVLNSDCTTVEQVCIFRICSPRCNTDRDCAQGSRCLQTQAGTACVANLVAACLENQPCPAGSSCQSGYCRNTCDVAGGCLSGQQCVQSACVGTDPAHDPGPDAGAEAGPVPDATDDETVHEDGHAGDAIAEVAESSAVTPDASGDALARDAVADAMKDSAVEAGCGDTSSDVHHCGACDHDCTLLPRVSASGIACAGGHCTYQCAAGHADCTDAGAGCQTDVSMSPNCGTCGTTCPAAAPLCAPSIAGAFSCQSGCPASAPDLCAMSCVDKTSNNANCGMCGTACTTTIAHATAQCVGSKCTTGCAPTYASCGSACVDLTSDDANCNTCSNLCTGGRHCVGSQCQCTNGTHLCGGQCVANDTSACGASCAGCVVPSGGTVACNGTQCVQSCTAAGYTICSNACVNETSDDNNCNGCTNQCTGGRHCVSSMCQCTGGAHLCSSQCVANDTSACGATCAACTMPTGGTVACNGTQCVQSCTAAGYTVCSNACVDQATDPANCGICGHACASGICKSNACVVVTKYGDVGPGSSSQGIVANRLAGVPIQVTAAGTLTGIGLVVVSGNPHVYLGLYSDQGNSPSNLLAQTAEITASQGRIESNVVTPIAISPGQYWLLAVADAQLLFASSGNSSTWFITNYTFAPLPAAIGATSILAAPSPNLYAIVQQ